MGKKDKFVLIFSFGILVGILGTFYQDTMSLFNIICGGIGVISFVGFLVVLNSRRCRKLLGDE